LFWQVAETCRTHGAADVEVYPTDLTDHSAVDSLAKQLLDKHKVGAMAVLKYQYGQPPGLAAHR